MKHNIWFIFVKVALCLSLLTKPHALARGEKVFHDTQIKNPTPVVRQSKPYREIEANISAYTVEGGNGDGITASGKIPVAGRTIAMDDVPFGTKVEIDGHVYVVEDRFGGNYTNRIDIFMESRAEALQWGRRWLMVKIYE